MTPNLACPRDPLGVPGELLEYTSPIPTTPRSELFTRHGHRLDEATSSLQKSIRRGQTDDACYWAAEMMDRYPHHVWRRLRTIVSEDVGIAWPDGPAVIRALYENATDERTEKRGNGAMQMMHAVILLAKAKKSRLVNHLLIVHGTGEDTYREPPDHALDRHTARGREMGRSWDHFWSTASLLADPETGELTAEGSIPDPYLDRARRVLADDGKEQR
jgi:replication-associated recombination protein RarA